MDRSDFTLFNLPSASSQIQIESVLHMILRELKKLYAHHAPQLKPRKRAKQETADHPESVDPIEDMYNILEGSALIPFMLVSEIINTHLFQALPLKFHVYSN